MSDDAVRGLPPRLLRFNVLVSEQLPTLSRIEIEADNGKHSFLVQRDMLEKMAQICVATMSRLSKPSSLS
jgi:hypothetical protein